MAARARASRTQIGGWLLAGAGALLLLAFASPYIGLEALDGPLLNLLFHAAMTAGFGLLAVENRGALRVAFAASALGWLLRIIALFTSLAGLVALGDLLAVVGPIVGASLLLAASKTARAGATALLIAAILGLAYIFPVLVSFLGPVIEGVPAVFGAMLLIAGMLLPRR